MTGLSETPKNTPTPGPTAPPPSGPIIAVPARTGYGGFRLHDRRGDPHPTSWYRDREMAQAAARALNAEIARENAP